MILTHFSELIHSIVIGEYTNLNCKSYAIAPKTKITHQSSYLMKNHKIKQCTSRLDATPSIDRVWWLKVHYT